MRPDLLVRISSDLVLLPAIWSETYTYVLTLALRTGLPVAAFDLGTSGERLHAYPNGHLPTYALASNTPACNDRLLAIDPAASRRLNGQIQADEHQSLMRNYYAFENLDQMFSLQEIAFAGSIEAIPSG